MTFNAPTPDISPPLAVGDVVTFSYESYSRREVPLNPKIQRVRTDLSWEEVLQNEAQETFHRTYQQTKKKKKRKKRNRNAIGL